MSSIAGDLIAARSSAIAAIQSARTLRLIYDAKQTLEIVQKQGRITGAQMSY